MGRVAELTYIGSLQVTLGWLDYLILNNYFAFVLGIVEELFARGWARGCGLNAVQPAC